MVFKPLVTEIVGSFTGGIRLWATGAGYSDVLATISSYLTQSNTLASDILDTSALADNYDHTLVETISDITLYMAGDVRADMPFGVSTNYGEPDQGKEHGDDFELDANLAAIAALTTTKGTILVGTGDSWDALAVGDDNTVLTAASGQPLGMQWATLPTGGGEGGTLDQTLQAIATLTPTTDQGIYFTATDAAATFALTSFGRALVDDESFSAMRTTLGVAIGSNIQAWDPALDVLSVVTPAADKFPYFTATNNAALADLTAFARSLLADSDAASARATLGVVIGTDVQAYTADLDAWSLIAPADKQDHALELDAISAASSSANQLFFYTGLHTGTLTPFPVFGRQLVANASAAAARVTLGVNIGSDVQAWDADLDAISSMAKTKGNLIIGNGTGLSVLGVGADNQILVPDAAQALGVKWTDFDSSFLSLGSMADQNADSVAITGGTATLSSLAADTATIAAGSFTGDVSSANANITGGSIDGVPITDVPTPNNPGDAANKAYVDALVAAGTTDAELLAIAALSSAADQLPYFTGAGTAALTTLTSTGRALIDDANVAAMRTTLGLVIGTDVQAFDADLNVIAGLAATKGNIIVGTASGWSTLGAGTDGFVLAANSASASGLGYVDPGSFGLSDALTAIGALTPAADDMVYYTASNAAATVASTSYGRGLLDVANAAGARVYLGAVIGTNVQAWDADLDAIAALTPTKGDLLTGGVSGWTRTAHGVDGQVAYADSTQAGGIRWDNLPSGLALGPTLTAIDAETYAVDDFIYFSGTNTPAKSTVTAFARTLLDDVSSSAARATLGLTVGTDVQGHSSNLDSWSAIAPTAKQNTDVELTALSSLSSAADKLPYFTGVGTADLADFTSYARTLLDDADATTARATLGVTIGSDIQAWSQNLDDIAAFSAVVEGSIIFFNGTNWVVLGPGEDNQLLQTNSLVPNGIRWVDVAGNNGIFPVALNALGELTPAADLLPYFTDADSAAVTTLTAYARTLLDDADAATARTTLGVAIGTDVQAYDAELAALAELTSAADQLPYFTGAGTAALTTMTAAARGLLDDADAATMRTTLGVAIGADVQAWDADLDTIAALAHAKGSILVSTATDWALLAAGSDNEVLLADSTQTNGIKWGASPINDPELSALAGLTSTADALPYFTGAGTADVTTFTSAARALLDDADAASMRTTLGLSIGSDVQAYDPDLAAIAALANSKGGLIVGGSSGWSFLGVGSNGQVLTADSAQTQGVKWGDGGTGGGGSTAAAYRNRIINPFGRWKQSGLGSQADITYGFDQWYVLTQTAAISSSQLTDVENGMPYAMRYTQAQGTAQRFGIAQPLEALESKDLRGKNVTLKARVRCSAATTIRFAIIEWTGGADAITKDFVNNWASTTFTPGNFFTSTSTTITATDSAILSAGVMTDVTLTGTIGSSANNIIVLFWTDSAQAQNATLDISAVWFGQGDAPSPSVEIPAFADDFLRCERFYEKSYDPDENPGTAGTTGVPLLGAYANIATVSQAGAWITYKMAKLKTPNFTPYSPTTGAAGKIRYNGSPNAELTATITTVALSGCEIITPAMGSGSVLNYGYHYTCDGRL